MVVGGFSVVDVADIPPVRLNPARVVVQSLFGSCCLRYAASASKGTISEICVVGGGCDRCGLGGCDSAVALTFGGSSPVVDAGLPVLLPFAMACIGGGSFSGGGSRWFP